MKVIIAGAGIGGLTAALSLRAAGIEVVVFEQARELGELGVGINVLSHATRELAALSLLPAVDRAGIRTRERIDTNQFGTAKFACYPIHGFDDVESVLPSAEREAIVKGYARLAGYAVAQVNRRWEH